MYHVANGQSQFFEPFLKKIPYEILDIKDFYDKINGSEVFLSQVEPGIDFLNKYRFLHALESFEKCKQIAIDQNLGPEYEAHADYFLGKTYLEREQIDSAVKYLHRTLGVVHKSVSDLGTLYLDEKRPDSVIRYANYAQVLNANNPDLNFFIARSFILLNKHSQAKKYAKKALDADPHYLLGYVLLANIHEANQSYQAALGAINDGIIATNEHPRAILQRVYLNLRWNKTVKAYEDLQTIMKLDPDFHFVKQIYGELKIKEGDFREGGKYFAQGIAGHPVFVNLKSSMGLEYEHAEMVDFIEYLSGNSVTDQEYELFGRRMVNIVNRSDRLFGSGIVLSAIPSGYQNIQPSSDFGSRFDLYVKITKAGDPYNHLDLISRVIRKSHAENVIMLDLNLRSKIQPEIAISMIEDRIRSGNEDPLLYFYRSTSETRLGLPDQADHSLDTCLIIDPHFDLAYMRRGELFFQKGDSANALSAYKMALRIAPENDDYALKVEELTKAVSDEEF